MATKPNVLAPTSSNRTAFFFSTGPELPGSWVVSSGITINRLNDRDARKGGDADRRETYQCQCDF